MSGLAVIIPLETTVTVTSTLVAAVLLTFVVRLASRRLGRRFFSRGGQGDGGHGARVRSIVTVFSNTLAAAVWIVALFVILGELGVNTGALLASAGVLGVALGFGAQKLVADFLGGFFIIAEAQYAIGDQVRIGTVAGTVEDITLRLTTLRDVSGAVHLIPNGEIRLVTNLSRDWAQATLDFDVDAGVDPVFATTVIGDAARVVATEESWADRFVEEPVVLGVEAVTAGALTLRLVAKVRAGAQYDVARELRQRVKAALDAAGIPAPPLVLAPRSDRPGAGGGAPGP